MSRRACRTTLGTLIAALAVLTVATPAAGQPVNESNL